MPGGLLFAYTSEIQATLDEVWEAAHQVIEKDYGIDTINEKKRLITSDWSYDQVTRKKPLLPLVKSTEIKETFERRYKTHVTLKQVKDLVEIRVKGEFEQKALREQGAKAKWKNHRPKSQDYIVEREVFFKILERLEKNKRWYADLAEKPAAEDA